jgi:hypothetical protein
VAETTALKADGDTNKNKLVFGIVVDVNGTEVPISTDDIDGYEDNGFKFELPQPVELGSFQDLFTWLSSNFGVEVPSAANLPDPLDKMVGAVETLVFSVDQLAFQIPGKNQEGKPTTYNLRISGSWDQAKPIIPGLEVLKLKGGVFGVTNMDNSKA